MAEEKKAARDRKANFTKIEAELISERVTSEMELLKGNHSNEITNHKKNEMWKKITAEVNALGVCCRSETEVKNKYRNMCRGAKEKFTMARKESEKTGGGPPPSQLSAAEVNIVNAMRDSASFIGVDGGLETNVVISSNNQSQLPVTTSQIDEPCTATPATPTIQESVWINALERHHARLEQTAETSTRPLVGNEAEISMSAVCPTSSASVSTVASGTTTSSSLSRSSIQAPPSKKRKTADDVYQLQCAVLEKQLVKTDLQIQLLNKIVAKMDDADVELNCQALLSVLGQSVSS